ncbi:MAG TPA: CHAT domain-containing protein [Longimicrobium sp.]|jgi:CHAT domain-containing protein/tetratricopeptide (TPR) repeat protein|uniref:CHAT domain-containing protein n=1 Tax=Longimicrobium sp. TaxID=2029185 RepID=UPI002ED9F616
MTRRGLVALAAGVLFGGAVGVRLLSGAPGTTLLGNLVQAQPHRATAARFSIPTRYRLCTVLPDSAKAQVPRESCGDAEDARLDLHAFAGAGASFDPDSLHASALAGVIWWDESAQSINDAIARLDKALRLSRRRVPLLADLSGVHLVRAERTQNARDLVVALNFALEALSREPRNVVALFNAALALQALGIDEQAVLAWDTYLAADSLSPWAVEARLRRHALLSHPAPPTPPARGAAPPVVEAFATRYPQEARFFGWEHVLGDWGKALIRKDTAGAALHLAYAGALGAALERSGGDATLADAVRTIRAARGNARATAALARGHRDYAGAQALYHGAKHRQAEAAFDRIVRGRPPSPALLQWATVFHAGMLVYAENRQEAQLRLEALLKQVDRERYPALEARGRGILGTVLLRAGRYPEARAEYEMAAEAFERLREVQLVGVALTNAGEAAYDHGDTLGAYRLMHRSMRILRNHRGSVWLHNQLFNLATFASLDGMPWAARIIQDEDVAVATRVGNALSRVETLVARAHLRMVSGDTAGAAADLGAAAAQVDSVPSGARKWAEETVRFARAVVQSGKAGPPAAASRDSAVHYFEKDNNVAWLLRALVRRADARLTEGDLAGATSDLEAATARVQALSRREDDRWLRSAMMEQARSRFDQLMMLHLRAGRTAEALRTLERARTSFTSGPQASARLTAPPGEVALEYALVGDTLLVWTVRGEALDVHEAQVDRGEFLLAVEELGAALESPAGAARVHAGLRRLYEWLVRPVREHLGPPGTPVVILVDGEVAGVPFAALLDSVSGRYLVQDHPLRFAPSLSDARRPLPAIQRSGGPALLIADPAFDRARHPTLDPLPWALAEVDSLRLQYPRPVLLRGDSATRAAVMEHAGRARIIHYAGHALFDDARPERSLLLLAGADTVGRVIADTADTSGQLTAYAVRRLRLGGVRLVVLSACGTLRSREGRSGGFTGLTGALLSAGAGGVLGSLWRVDDRSTVPLMVEFHREYARSEDPAAALRHAQLRMLSLPDSTLQSPFAWAGFRYVGN